MLYKFSFKNFKSYKNETIFDMRAENINEFEETLLIDKNGEKILPVSAIYGPNAGGKSAFLDALVCLISVVMKPRVLLRMKETVDKNAFLGNLLIPYKFDEESEKNPVEFEIYYSTKLNEYKYNLSILENNTIISESLYKKQFNAKKPAKIFERKKNKIEIGEILKKENVVNNVNESMPYLTFISITNNIPIINDAISWFENIVAINYATTISEKKIEIYDNAMKELLLRMFRAIDIDIYDYRIEESEENDEIKNVYTKHKNNNHEYEINFKEESEGTKKLFNLIPNAIHALINGGLAIFDEMDAKLHPKLIKYIIMLFKDKNFNKRNAQLILTSQDLTTMNNQVFRRDEIWFASKNENKESELYSLYEIRDEKGERIRANAAYSRQYLTGKYGADPYLTKMLNWEVDDV